jgi:hypothetical protein
MAAIITFFCLYSFKPIFSNFRKTLNRKYRPSLSNLILFFTNFLIVFSISVAIVRKVYSISKIFLLNDIKNGIPILIDIKYLILSSNGLRGYIFFILFYITATELFALDVPSTNIFLKFPIAIKSKNDNIGKSVKVLRAALRILSLKMMPTFPSLCFPNPCVLSGTIKVPSA